MRSARCAALAGMVLLGAAAALVIVGPPSWLMIGVAVAAWAALSRDRRLGPLAAALTVVLALPYDRAADAFLLRMASIPVRPHDVVIGLAVLVSLPSLRHVQWTPAARLLAAFAAIGVGALLLGTLNGHEARDILRDGRWWGLYAVALLATGQPRPQRLVRGLLAGVAVYSLLVVIATLLPAFDDGIKEPAIAFDVGILRMQFGNTAFLLLPMALLASRLAAPRGGLRHAAWLAWFAAALALSVTRISIVTSVIVVVAAAVGLIAVIGPRRGVALRAAAAIGTVIAGLLLGIGINAAGVAVEQMRPPQPILDSPASASAPASVTPASVTPASVVPASVVPSPTPLDAPTPAPTPAPAVVPQGPLTRFVPELEHFLGSIGERFESYRNALALISASPLIGHGAGVLVEADYEFGAGEFATEGKLPNVDNAYLTVAMKAGLVGAAVFAALALWPVWRLWATTSRRAGRFLLPAWLGLLVLTMTQGFAVIGHSPFALGLLIVAIDRLPRRPTPQDR